MTLRDITVVRGARRVRRFDVSRVRASMERAATRFVGLAAAGLLVAACGYNTVVEQDEDVKGSWSEVQNQYQRRADLVPNLVNSVKAVANFEQSTLQAVTAARASATAVHADASILDDPARFKKFEQAQTQLSGALGRLLVVSEKYPELRATEAFGDLMAQLEGTENRIAVARRRYIGSVAEYNKTVLRFPSMMGAKLRGKTVRPTFEATTPGADKVPQVKF
jgi:LemA protein